MKDCVDVVLHDEGPSPEIVREAKETRNRGKLRRTIGNSLSIRKQRVCIKGKWSTWVSIGNVIPQGSVLGPLNNKCKVMHVGKPIERNTIREEIY